MQIGSSSEFPVHGKFDEVLEYRGITEIPEFQQVGFHNRETKISRND